MDPMSSTPHTVPFVPFGGACVSSIQRSWTLAPVGYCLRRWASFSLLIGFTRDTSFECTAARKILNENLSVGFKFFSAKSKAEEKAPKCVFLIVDFFLFYGDPLLRFRHLTQL